MISTGKKFVGLEILRFMSSVVILIWHYQHFITSDTGRLMFMRHSQPFYGVLFPIYEYGNYAVNLFWMISGYIFYWKYKEEIGSGAVSFRSFFIRRFSRLYPLHMLTMIIVAMMQSLYGIGHSESFIYGNNDSYHFALHSIMAADWGLQRGTAFNGPIWSVSVEVLIYFSFFLVSKKMNLDLKRIVSLVVFLIIAKMALPWIKDLVLCGLYFFIGCGVYIMNRDGRIGRKALVFLFVLCFVAICANVMTNGKFHTISVSIVYLTLVSTFSMIRSVGRSEILWITLGNLTYASYLIHFPSQLFLVLVTDKFSFPRDAYLQEEIFVGFLFGVLALSWFVHEFFERPAQQWIRTWAVAR